MFVCIVFVISIVNTVIALLLYRLRAVNASIVVCFTDNGRLLHDFTATIAFFVVLPIQHPRLTLSFASASQKPRRWHAAAVVLICICMMRKLFGSLKANLPPCTGSTVPFYIKPWLVERNSVNSQYRIPRDGSTFLCHFQGPKTSNCRHIVVGIKRVCGRFAGSFGSTRCSRCFCFQKMCPMHCGRTTLPLLHIILLFVSSFVLLSYYLFNLYVVYCLSSIIDSARYIYYSIVIVVRHNSNTLFFWYVR